MRGNAPLRVWLIGCRASELLAVRASALCTSAFQECMADFGDNGITATAFGVREQRDLLPVAE